MFPPCGKRGDCPDNNSSKRKNKVLAYSIAQPNLQNKEICAFRYAVKTKRLTATYTENGRLSHNKEVIIIRHSNCCGPYDLSALPEEVKAQLDLLDEAEFNLLFILVSIVLRFHILDVQRGMLLTQTLCPEEFQANDYPDPFVMQVVASILTLYALFGFHQQAQGIASQAQAAGGDACPQEMEALLSLIVILVSLIRFGLLLDTNPALTQTQEPAALAADLEDI